MAVVSAQIAVSTTRAKLSDDDDRGGSSLLVQAPAGATLYVGGPDVTPANGYPVPAAGELSVDLKSNEDLYGVLASGAGTAAVLRVGA